MIYLLLFTHWVADFIFQNDDMAKNKSKSNVWLGKHILAYMIVLSPFALYAGWRLPGEYWMLFVLINGAVHFIIDWCTSRMTSKLWAQQRVHDFFVVVGFDQLLHACTLIATYKWLFL